MPENQLPEAERPIQIYQGAKPEKPKDGMDARVMPTPDNPFPETEAIMPPAAPIAETSQGPVADLGDIETQEIPIAGGQGMEASPDFSSQTEKTSLSPEEAAEARKKLEILKNGLIETRKDLDEEIQQLLELQDILPE
jgi:hypothetical protein